MGIFDFLNKPEEKKHNSEEKKKETETNKKKFVDEFKIVKFKILEIKSWEEEIYGNF